MARKSRKHLYDNNLASNTITPSVAGYNAAAYVRLSSDDTKKRGDSIETQRNIIENYAAANPDIRIVETYSDIQATGTNFERPGFMRMLSDMESGKINCVIVKDISRFGRNAIDGGYYLDKYLPSLGIRFIAVTDNYDSNNPENALLVPLMNIVNESYALDIGRKVRAVHRQNIADGRFVGRLAPYGYMKPPDDCHRLVPDMETAPIVKQIFGWASENTSVMEIARRLNSAGIQTPAKRNLAKGYDKTDISTSPFWQPRTIAGMLKDRVYLGDMVQGKTRTVNGKSVPVDPSEWVCVASTHEPIVSLELFDKVQTIRQNIYDAAKHLHDNRNHYSPNAFLGKVLCGSCGYLMRRHRNTKTGEYWFRCCSQLKYGKDACTVVSAREADVAADILGTIKNNGKVILKKHSGIDGSTANLNGNKSNAEASLKEIERKLGNKGLYLKSLYENMVNGIITAEEYAQMKNDYENEIKVLMKSADELRSLSHSQEEERAKLGGIAESIAAALSGNSLDADVVDRLVDKIVISPDKSFDVYYSFDNNIQEAC